MLVLFEHGTTKGLARVLSGHTIQTAQAKRWDTLSNGALLNAAEEAGFKLRQHQVSRVQQHAERIAAAVASATPGSYAEVEIPFEPK